MTTKNEIWDQIKQSIRGNIPKSAFKTWFSETALLEITPEMALVEVPNKFIASWLSENYIENMRQLLGDVIGTRPAIRFSYGTPRKGKIEREKRIRRSSKTSYPSGLDPSRTFSDFITARSNKRAFSSALDVAINPSYKYNPLYIFSKRSSGKTHLLHAIGNEAMRKNPDNEAVYLSAENAISKVEKTSPDEISRFWGKEKTPRFLLLDDIQAVVSHGSAQKKLLSLCNQFLEAKRQLVIAASASPNQIRNVMPQLRSCLEWGLITEMMAPDQEMKMKIVRRKAKQYGIQLQEDAAFFLANSTNDLNTLVRWVQELKTRVSIPGNKIDMFIVQSILKNNPRTQTIGPQRIQEITAKYFKLSPDDLLSQKKERKISYPRQLAIFLTRDYTRHVFEGNRKCFRQQTLFIYNLLN